MNHYNQRGSLLLEALMVVVILSVGLTFIIQSLSSSLKALNYASQYTQGAFLMDAKLSEILLKKTVPANFQESGSMPAPFEKFRYQITTKPAQWNDSRLPSESVSQVALKLSWPSGKRTQEMDTTLCLLNP